MYYRRKILLSLLQIFGGKLKYTYLQKYLFLVTRMQDKPVYDFVPYKYGPFSFQSYADIRALIKRDFLTRSVRINPGKTPDYFNELSDDDQLNLQTVYSEFGGMKYSELIRYTYSNYPEYSTFSEIRSDYLPDKKLHGMQGLNNNTGECLFTIGYEGISIDSYIFKLLENDISHVVDVRKNPSSMKYGFAKSQLIRLLGKFGITYDHVPQLGIKSSKRKELHSFEDYEKLFKEYELRILPDNVEYIRTIIKALSVQKRMALTCFESEAHMCHRHKITEYLKCQTGWDTPIRHV